MTNIFDEELSQWVKNITIKLNAQEKSINYKSISFKRDKNLKFDFRVYKSLKDFLKKFIFIKF